MNVGGLLVLAACFCLSQSFLTEDLETVKRQALEKIDHCVELVENYSSGVLGDAENSLLKMNRAGKNRLKYGEFIFNSTLDEIQRVAEVAYDRADIWSSSVKVWLCIVEKRKSLQDYVRDRFFKNFVPTAEMITRFFTSACENGIFNWREKTYAICERHSSLGKKTKSDINRAKTVIAVKNLVHDFTVQTNDVLDTLKRDDLPRMICKEKMFEGGSYNTVDSWRKQTNEIRNKTVSSIQECFSSESTSLSKFFLL